MLGCIQPMSSPMMKMMLGFCCCCAAAGRFATIPAATNASRARHAFPMMFIRTLLTFRLRGGRTIETIEEPRMGLLDCRREQSLRLETRIDHAGLVHVRPLPAFSMMFIRTLPYFSPRGGRTKGTDGEPRLGVVECRREASLPLGTPIYPAGLLPVRPLHNLPLGPPPRELPMCLCDASTY